MELNENDIREIARQKATHCYTPSSVYRIQLNRDFTFKDVLAILPYLKELGIEALYLSPIFEVIPGSPHGYNVTDPNNINPEIGSEQDFYTLTDSLKQMGMGLILDLVPNHMGISSNNNRWWQDVLENGPSSRYAHFFDIDWEPVKNELKDKVLLPVLGDQYGATIENQEIQVIYADGSFSVRYGDRLFPIAPDTYPQILERDMNALKNSFQNGEDRDLLEYLSILASMKNLPPRTEREHNRIEERGREKEISKERLKNLVQRSKLIQEYIQNQCEVINGQKGNMESFNLLDDLLTQQSYRLAYWKVASEEINYRRFFDVNDLAAIRVENDEVFDHVHRLTFELLENEKVQGLRIDHPDGLYDPVAYFRKLQQKYLFHAVKKELNRRLGPVSHELEGMVQKVLKEDDSSQKTPLYVVVEKILDRQEDLPENWTVHGTVGYDFLNALNGLFIARKNEEELTQIYEHFTHERKDFDQLLYEKKKFFAAFYMSSELNTLAHRLDIISEKIRRYRDFTLSTLTTALREVIACFPVYRTYIRTEDTSVSERDEKYIHHAIEKAKHKHPALSSTLFDFLEHALLGRFDEVVPEKERRLLREFVLKFQQLTSPIMAKGLEDTVFYIYNRLLSLNEVGGDAIHFGYSRKEFHRQNMHRRKRWPNSFITSSTHDTKRSKDVRMRLNVLSELPKEWKNQLQLWSQLNGKHATRLEGATFPDKNTEYFIYQTLLGSWPNESMSPEQFICFRDRLWNYLLKSVREAKTFTNWLNPNHGYEEAVKKFVFSILSTDQSGDFLKNFIPFQNKIKNLGIFNSLSAIILKISSPGVVDYYQGAGIWEYSLTDPDNRRPVDYPHRKSFISDIQTAVLSGRPESEIIQELLSHKEDGRIKMFFLWKALNLRRRYGNLFLEGDYIPLTLKGEKEQNAVAFMRKNESGILVTVCGRFFSELGSSGHSWPAGEKNWGNTVLVLPKDLDFKSFDDVLTGKTVHIVQKDGRKVLNLSEVFGTLSAAMLAHFE